jgi:hypothetical protein
VWNAQTVVSARYYLADACFLVGLEVIRRCWAICTPPAQPSLADLPGRKAFVPGEPVWLEDGLLKATG